jgi:hypothetical protein
MGVVAGCVTGVAVSMVGTGGDVGTDSVVEVDSGVGVRVASGSRVAVGSGVTGVERVASAISVSENGRRASTVGVG